MKSWAFWFPGPYKLGRVTDSCNPSTWDVEAGGSWAQGYPQIHSETEASLGYNRLIFLLPPFLFPKMNSLWGSWEGSWKLGSNCRTPGTPSQKICCSTSLPHHRKPDYHLNSCSTGWTDAEFGDKALGQHVQGLRFNPQNYKKQKLSQP